MSRPGPRRGRRGSAQNGRASSIAARLRRLRIALRIARRSNNQALGRSALIVALITLPVAGMTAVCVVTASMTPTGAEQATVLLGHSGASVTVVGSSAVSQSADGSQWGSSDGSPDASGTTKEAALSAIIPRGEAVIPVLGTSTVVRTNAGEAALDATVGRVWDSAMHGRFRMLAGRAPRAADEVLATPAALKRIGARIGDDIHVLVPHAGTVRVVGTIDPRWTDSSHEALYGLPGAFGTPVDTLDAPTAVAYLPRARFDWSQVKQFNKRGALVVSRQVLLDPPPAGSYDTTYIDRSPFFTYFYGSMFVGFALLEVLLLAGAAFLVGARRQERALATVASVGAGRGTLVAIISSSGLVLGSVSGVIGVTVGIGAGAAFMALTGNGNATRYWGFRLDWPVLIAIALGAIVVGWLGAIVPAIRASRIDVVAALRGSRRPLPARRHRPIIGVIVVAFGLAATIAGGAITVALQTGSTGNLDVGPLSQLSSSLLIGGPVLMILGLLLVSGLLLRLLARWSSHGPIALRLAARDAARNAGRSVPAVAAVLVTVFVAIFAMTMMASSESTDRARYEYEAQPGQLVLPLAYWDQNEKPLAFSASEVVAAARQTLTSPKTAVLRAVPDGREYLAPDALPPGVQATDLVPHLNVPASNQCPADRDALDFDRTAGEGTAAQSAYLYDDPRCANRMSSSPALWVMDASQLALVTGRDTDATVHAALSDGKAIALNPLYEHDGQVSVSWWSIGQWREHAQAVQRTAPARTEVLPAVTDTADPLLPYGVVISPATARRLGLPFSARSVLADPRRPATQQQLDALNGILDARAGAPDVYHALAETGPPSTAGPTSWALLALSGLIAIGATAVAIGLARSDGRRDQATLSAIGASPRTTRAFGLWQAIVLTALGTVLGAGVGLIPALALMLPGSATTFAPPWPQIVATAVLLPAAIGCLVWLLPARRVARLRSVMD